MGEISLGVADVIIRVSKGAAAVIAALGWLMFAMLVRVAVFVPTWQALADFMRSVMVFYAGSFVALVYVVVKTMVMAVRRPTTPPDDQNIDDQGCVRLENTYICHRGDGGEVV